MKTIKKINSDTIKEFAEKIEQCKINFIPMLPFVKMPFHDFDRYKLYSEKGIYLIDYIGEEYCLYHLYHLTQGDDTLRTTLILPSNWDKRFDIIEASIPNIKRWFMEEDSSGRFIIQSLEYGEIEYYPTLSHYIIPTIIKNGFTPKYRMYMKRDTNLPLPQTGKLDKGLSLINYSEELFNDVIDFYYKNESTKNLNYFSNCTYDEFIDMFKQEFVLNNSKFIKNDRDQIIAGIIVSKDSGKVWVDNFTIHPEYDKSNVGEVLLNETLKSLSKLCPDERIYIYLNRDCKNAVSACEKNGFASFEFWTDMILER